MEVPEAIARDLKALDESLRARFATEPGRGGAPSPRWVVERFSPKAGKWVEVMRVCNEDGSYRPLDNRVLVRLHEMDTWAHGGQNWATWNGYARRNMMNKMGLRESESDPFMEPWERAAERRYHENAAAMAEEFMSVIRKDPNYCHLQGGDEKALRQRLDDADEVRHAKRINRGILERHPKYRHVRVRPGSQ